MSSATEIRYRDDAQRWTRKDKASHAYIGRTHTLDTDALAEAMRA